MQAIAHPATDWPEDPLQPCTKCGTWNLAGGHFCARCGGWQGESFPPLPGPPAAPAPRPTLTLVPPTIALAPPQARAEPAPTTVDRTPVAATPATAPAPSAVARFRTGVRTSWGACRHFLARLLRHHRDPTAGQH